MKSIYVTVLIVALMAVSNTLGMSVEIQNQMKALVGACMSAEGASEADTVEMMTMLKPSTATGACLHACVMEKTGIIVDGQFSVENSVAAAKHVTEDNAEKVKLVETITADCAAKVAGVSTADRCAYAKAVVECNIDGASAHGYLQRDLLSP